MKTNVLSFGLVKFEESSKILYIDKNESKKNILNCFNCLNYKNRTESIFNNCLSDIFILIDQNNDKIYFHLKSISNLSAFYNIKKNAITIGLKYHELLKELSLSEFNKSSIYSNLLFNYPIQESSHISDIYQIRPGCFMVYNPATNSFENKNINYKFTEQSKTIKPSSILSENLLNGINNSQPVLLSMTGGFDSRVNFALLLKLGVKFEAFTFGNPNSNDAVPAIKLCDQYGIKHHLIDLNKDFYRNREKYVDRLIKSSLNNPFVLDLAHYEFVKEIFPASNIITGYMGGEILTGGTVGSSQVTFTQMAKDLLSSENIVQFKSKFLSNFDIQFINLQSINDLDDFLNTFSNYFFKKNTNNQNLTNFLLKEKYHKFFGVIKSIYSDKHNQIDTFMAPEYFSYIHKLKFNYNNTPLFKRNPINNYYSRRFYAQIIKETTPSLLDSKLDRGYKVKDLLSPLGLYNISKNYFLNHTGRGNKLNIKTIDYRKWFEADVFEYLKYINQLQDYFNKKFIDNIIDKYNKDENAYPVSVFNKLMVIYGLMKAIHLIKEQSERNKNLN